MKQLNGALIGGATGVALVFFAAPKERRNPVWIGCGAVIGALAGLLAVAARTKATDATTSQQPSTLTLPGLTAAVTPQAQYPAWTISPGLAAYLQGTTLIVPGSIGLPGSGLTGTNIAWPITLGPGYSLTAITP